MSTLTQQPIRGPALVLRSFRFLSEDWGEFQNGMHMDSWKEALKNTVLRNLQHNFVKGHLHDGVVLLLPSPSFSFFLSLIFLIIPERFN